VQTNGTLRDDEWGQVLKEHDFLGGISIDGPREMHDAYRVDKGGKPTFDRVMAGLDVLKRHDVDWNVLTTIHAVNGGHGREVYTFFRDELGARFIQFIPIIERATEENFAVTDSGWGDGVKDRPLYKQEGYLVTHRSIGPEQYGRFRSMCSRSGSDATSGPSTSRCSIPRSRTGTANPRGWASMRRRAGCNWPSSTPATCTRAITSWNPTTCSATSGTRTC
jgi:MoaA/NifB/PqqE/SkfB family radical SAM enzyme